MIISTEDGYWFSFSEKDHTYTIHKFDTEVDYGRADNIEAVMDWFDRFIERARTTHQTDK